MVDGRSKESIDKRHIPSAINIPRRGINRESVSDFDKSKIYVYYCDAIGCNASTKTALKLLKLGFTAKELIGGLDWWLRDEYSTEGSLATVGKDISCGC